MMTMINPAILIAVLQLVVQGRAAELLVSAGPEDATTVHTAVKTETAVLYVQPNMIGDNSFWKTRSHVHPAWSRDGRRVYFNAWPADSSRPQLMVADVATLLKKP